MESVSYFFVEDNDKPIEAGQEEEDDDEAVCHDLIAGLYSFVMILQFLGSDVNVVFTTTIR